MDLNSTPTAERVQIGFFGTRNAGKSSLINAITNQKVSIVSDVEGTTTDPVSKSMELQPIGPITVIDTPGFDDEGELGDLRVQRTKQILNKVDIAVLVVDSTKTLSESDKELIEIFKARNIKYIIAYNKTDLTYIHKSKQSNEIWVSALKNINIRELKERIIALYGTEANNRQLVKDLANPGDFVILVTPIDSSAPKGRLILPQQQVLRELIENNVITSVIQETELKATLSSFNRKPQLIITDSQVFEKVDKIIPEDIPLTSFSILFARYKGILETAIKGVRAIDTLEDNDRILIAEGCTHHRQCDDIGTVKIPRWLQAYTEKKLHFDYTTGIDFPDEISDYKMIIHCGGCMLNTREVLHRYNVAQDCNIATTNYGIVVAYMTNILKRTIDVFPDTSLANVL